MFLLGEGIRSKSITSYIKNPPPPITNEKVKELVVKLKQGDKSVIEELILGHIRLAIYIAGKYANFAPKKDKDLISESFLGLMLSCRKTMKGDLKDDDFTRYATYRMHKLCGNFVLEDKLIRVPISSRYKNKLKDHIILNDTDPINKMMMNPLHKLILDEKLEAAIKTQREKEVIELRIQGYTQKEVAERLKISQSTVYNDISSVEKRFFDA